MLLDTYLQKYQERAYGVIPLYPRSKRPTTEGWQSRDFTREDFNDSTNVGLKSGKPSNGLVDVDLDCAEAIAMADAFLPYTGMRHGRMSQPGTPSA
jgi:hypothetical protein